MGSSGDRIVSGEDDAVAGLTRLRKQILASAVADTLAHFA
jgi:hypothetical protein